MADTALWDDYMARGLGERERKLASRNLVRRADCPVETSAMGILRWYLHPAIGDVATHAYYRFEQEIPVGSRSGKVFHQGGIGAYVLAGRGVTVVDGSEHEWEKEDLIGIPMKNYGVTFQHFNTGDEPARLLVTFANFDDSLGPELGVDMAVLEPAPEYAAAGGS